MSKIDEICEILDRRVVGLGNLKSGIDNLFVFRANEPTEFMSGVYEPSLCMALKGSKIASVGEDLYRYDNEKFLLVATHLPAVAKIESCPYLAIKITFSLEDILSVINEIGGEANVKSKFKGLRVEPLSDELIDSVAKLVSLLDREKDAKFLYKLAVKEILYTILNRESGEFLRQYAILETTENKITRAAREIKANFAAPININELARKIGLSSSSLYHNFKRITSLSPLQFQKKIRLEEAKNLILNQNLNAIDTAFAVGYESASQFSREYARMFGLPPKTHFKALTEKRA